MTKRTTTSDEDHNRLVKAMAQHFEKQHMFVKADHIGHPNGRPSMIGNHIPDVEATAGNEKIIAEAETPDTFDLPETKEQFIAFSKSLGKFHVIVPKGHIPDMELQAKKWGVAVDQYWEVTL